MNQNKTQKKSFELMQQTEFNNIFQKTEIPDTRASHIEFETLLDFMGDIEGKRVLDLGCGIGRNGIKLAQYAGEVIGYDISQVAVEKANNIAKQLGINNFRAELNNFSNVPEASFDIILCVNMLHHSQDPQKVIGSINKALRQGGKLVILENNPLNPLFPMFFLLIGQVKAHWTQQYLMVNRFTLGKFITSAGMSISKVERYGFLPTMLYNFSMKFKSLNEVLNRIPVINELSAFHFIKAEKQEGFHIHTEISAGRQKRFFLRAIFLHINAVFPFLYPMRHVLNGRVFTGLYHYAIDLLKYRKADSMVNSGFPLKLRNTFPCLLDRYQNAGSLPRHYFWQDLWGARKVFQSGVKRHYDIGSRLDGFVAHCLPFCEIVMLDIRPLTIQIQNLQFQQANCMDMSQIADGSIQSLSSFHAIEHFGLGRYGDPIDPLGHQKAIFEMKRIVCSEGMILFSVPIGVQRIEFNGHRIFDPLEVIRLFKGFELVEFSVTDDDDVFHENVAVENCRTLNYGCGLFHFKKKFEGNE